MEWWQILILLLFGMIALLFSGIPVAFAFGMVNLAALYFFLGGLKALPMVAFSAVSSVSSFLLVAIPLFMLMGTVLLESRVSEKAIDIVDRLLGEIPGRLGVVTVFAGGLFAAVSGSTTAANVMLGRTLIPEMLKRGYDKGLSVGVILAGATLSTLIPPSALAVLFAGLSGASVGQLLIGGIIPGILTGFLFAAYILIRASLNPQFAPAYALGRISALQRLKSLLHLLPLGILVFLVTGLIYLGVTTPSEAAAVGAAGAFAVAIIYRGLNWQALKRIMLGTAHVTGMIFLIITGSKAYGQVLAFSGAARGLVEMAEQLPVSPMVLLLAMFLLVIVLGMLMDPVSIMFITVPIYMPLIDALGFNPIWFGVIFVNLMELAGDTPPFGIHLFAVKSVAPEEVTLRDIYRGTIPFVLLQLTGVGLLIAFPPLVTWLPGTMMP